MNWQKRKKDLARAGALGDKVIGKGAALLCKYIGGKRSIRRTNV